MFYFLSASLLMLKLILSSLWSAAPRRLRVHPKGKTEMASPQSHSPTSCLDIPCPASPCGLAGLTRRARRPRPQTGTVWHCKGGSGEQMAERLHPQRFSLRAERPAAAALGAVWHIPPTFAPVHQTFLTQTHACDSQYRRRSCLIVSRCFGAAEPSLELSAAALWPPIDVHLSEPAMTTQQLLPCSAFL